MSAYDPQFLRGWTVGIDDDAVAHYAALLLQGANQACPRLVRPGGADDTDIDAERRKVADDVGREPERRPRERPAHR